MHINIQCLATQLLSKLEFLAQFQAWPARAKKNYHKELHAVNRNSLCLLGDSIAIRHCRAHHFLAIGEMYIVVVLIKM
ncbi:hypothetical protein CY35_05G020700 [Sphagnum magellanicum]|nr:hypothetical protein CY35_05G020700 [Sphagnum magellanicum]